MAVCAPTVRAIGAALILVTATFAVAGSLTPPAGPVAPTPGPEPRIAINAINTPGDSDSIFKIIAPGSYYLTGNLTGVSGKRGIEVAVSNVSIDLMGFALIGVAGSFDGVTAPVGGTRAIEVRSGTIRSWGGSGVTLLSASVCRVESIRAIENGTDGLVIGSNSTIVACVAHNNQGYGVVTGNACTVTQCVASSNGGFGMDLATGSTATGCTATANGNAGIICTSGCVVSQCTANENTDDGIMLGTGCTATECVAMSNADDGIVTNGGRSLITRCIALNNESDGIQVSANSTVIENQCDLNTLAGIHATGASNRILDNQSSTNALGYDVDAAGNFLARNTATANTFSNWAVATGNTLLVIDAAVTAGTVTGDAGGISPGSTNPNANYTY